MRQLQLQCAKCEAITPHNQPTPRHVMHALLSLFVLGLWIPVWIVVAVGSGKEAAACVTCNNTRLPTGPATIAQGMTEGATKASQRTGLIVIAAMLAVGGALVAASELGLL
jgi:hypothetical protein